jgi:uncharacterized protein
VAATAAGVVVSAWLLLVVAAWGLQRHLVYLPDRSRPAAPADPRLEEVTFDTADGLRLDGWFLAVDPVAPRSGVTVLVCNGNAGNRAARLPLARALAAAGHQVLLFDYRGYGGNPGRPTEEGLVADARAAAEHLRARPDVDRLAYYGESIGAGVAAALAAVSPPDALVLRSPFPALADVGRRHYPFLPVRSLLRERFPTSAHLSRYDGPVLVLAGGADRIVPPALSAEVAAGAGASLHVLEGADHNDRALLDGAEAVRRVDAFLRGDH